MQFSDLETHLLILKLAQFHVQRQGQNTKGEFVSHMKACFFLLAWLAHISNHWQTPLIIMFKDMQFELS